MLKYIGGNTIKSCIKVSNNIVEKSKIPIINFAIEESSNKNKIYQEHINLITSINHPYKIAIKLSSFEFNIKIINKIIENSSNKNIQVIIDAEKNIDNDTYQTISNKLILKHNKYNSNVVKTYQMYRKDSLQILKNDLLFFKKNNIYLGTKLVRGAYWNTENNQGHLYQHKYETDINYNQGIIYLSENYNKNYNMLATHNKESINLGNTLNKYNNNQIFDFAHLLDMGENNYKNINKNSIHVYIPYGPYKEMIPYLMRRLYENIDTIKYMF